MKLKGQVAVVTGAGRGIGRAIAKAQADAGAAVALLARNAGELEAVAAEIKSAGGRANAYVADVLDLAMLEATFGAIERDLGPPDLVVNNAAAFAAIGPIWEVDPEAWQRDVETSLIGAFNGSRAALRSMRARGQGRVVNLVGGGTATSFPHGSGYGSGKAGLLRFTECAADSLIGSGVLVFALDPGLVRTAMTEHQLVSAAGQKYLAAIKDLFANGVDVPPEFAGELIVEIAAGRFDRMAGRMLMAARGDLSLDPTAIDDIVTHDLRALRVNGMPAERPHRRPE